MDISNSCLNASTDRSDSCEKGRNCDVTPVLESNLGTHIVQVFHGFPWKNNTISKVEGYRKSD